jgi:predicted amidohydrolase YtcJ
MTKELPNRFIVKSPAIHTMDDTDPVIASFAVDNETIVATSHGIDELDGYFDAPVPVIDVPEGQTVLPGFGDVHLHLLLAGHRITDDLQIELAWDTETILDAVARYAETADPSRWIEGGWWSMLNMDVLNDPQTRRRFDEATRGIPMLLRDESCHNRYVNARALELMGVDPGNASAHAPEVVVDENGVATGLLVESASRWAEETLERTTQRRPHEVENALAAAISSMNERGFTLIQDCGTGQNMMEALKSLDDGGKLNAWTVTSASINDKIFGFTPTGEPLIRCSKNYKGDRLVPTFAKIYEDGTPTTRTAYVHDAYVPDEEYGDDWRGKPNFTLEELVSWLELLAEEHMGCTIHCTGDASVTLVIDAVEAIAKKGLQVPVHIAHGEFIQDCDYARIRDNGITLDISPQLWYPSSFQEGAFAPMREDLKQTACQFRDQLDAGILIAGGSDWPCSPDPSAWFGIHGLVTRANPHGNYPGQVYLPEQAITLDEAIRAFTINVAKATGLDGKTGSISVGKSADFQIAYDPYACPSSELKNITTVRTVLGGCVVYEA